MSPIIFIIIFVLNFAISWWNAKSAGLVWLEVKQIGGWPRFMTWMAAIMSAVGFTWCYLIVLLFGWWVTQPSFIDVKSAYWLSEKAVDTGLSLGYLIIIPFALFSGLMIWIDSLVQAWRRRDLASIGIAAWNTYAQIHNTYNAIQSMPDAFDSVRSFFSSDSDSDDDSGGSKAGIIVIILVVFAIAGGVLTTWAIINRNAGTRELPERA